MSASTACGIGMPTILVMGGGSAHTMTYNIQGFLEDNNQGVIDALNAALARSMGMTRTHSATSPPIPVPVAGCSNCRLPCTGAPQGAAMEESKGCPPLSFLNNLWMIANRDQYS